MPRTYRTIEKRTTQHMFNGTKLVLDTWSCSMACFLVGIRADFWHTENGIPVHNRFDHCWERLKRHYHPNNSAIFSILLSCPTKTHRNRLVSIKHPAEGPQARGIPFPARWFGIFWDASQREYKPFNTGKVLGEWIKVSIKGVWLLHGRDVFSYLAPVMLLKVTVAFRP